MAQPMANAAQALPLPPHNIDFFQRKRPLSRLPSGGDENPMRKHLTAGILGATWLTLEPRQYARRHGRRTCQASSCAARSKSVQKAKYPELHMS
jgi:hypothetical protein